MTETIGLVVGTFGSNEWKQLGQRTLIENNSQFNESVHCHVESYKPESLAEARNNAVNQCPTDYICVLDADDKLHKNFVQHVRKHVAENRIVQPSTQGYYPNGEQDEHPVLMPPQNMFQRNYLIVGCVFNKKLFQTVGGYRHLPVLEDWDLWIRMLIAGAEIVASEQSIYYVYVKDEKSRNANSRLHGETYNQLRSEYKEHAKLLQLKGLSRR